MSGRLVLIRHGEPVGHAGRCVGHFDTQLASAALEPLRRLAGSATGSMATATPMVVSSDLRRAADSARVIARAWDAELRFDPRMRELSFGSWEGRTWEDIAGADRASLDAWGADWTLVAPPDGESGVQFAVRVRSAIDDAVGRTARRSGEVAVVTHAGWIRVATSILLAEPLGTAFDRTIDYARAAIFDLESSGARLLAWNVDTLDVAAVLSGASAPQPTRSSSRL